jgi:hypothetical protein
VPQKIAARRLSPPVGMSQRVERERHDVVAIGVGAIAQDARGGAQAAGGAPPG